MLCFHFAEQINDDDDDDDDDAAVLWVECLRVYIHVILLVLDPSLANSPCVSAVGFLRRDAIHSTKYAVARCPSVHLSVRHMPVLCQNG